jgi:type I restriction enzyme S subunit
MSDFHQEWREVPIGEICDLNPRDSGPSDPAALVSFVPMPAVSDDTGTILDHTAKPFSEVAKGYTRFRDMDVIFAKITPCMENGKIALATNLHGGFACGSTEFHVLRSRGAALPEYLWLFLRQKSVRIDAERHMTGAVGQRRVPVQFLKDTSIPLPPLQEQRRILDKLNELLVRSKNAREELRRVPKLIDRYRQAVLESAFSGALTARMRDGDAQTLADDIPKTWKWSRLSDICEAVVDCPHSTPKWTDEGKICIRTTNFKPGMLDLTEVRYVSEETFERRIARLTPQAGDIVYSREGGILGVACQIPENVKLCLGQRMMLMRPNSSSYSSALLMYFLNSPSTLTTVRELTGGTASPHLNVGDVKNFRVPVPPHQEQLQIVGAIKRLFRAADNIELQCKSAAKLIDRLDQAALAKAFRGELVVKIHRGEHVVG